MKKRSIQLMVVASLTAILTTAGHGTPSGVRIVRPADLAWRDIPGYPPGYQRAVLEGATDRSGPVTYRVRLPAHFRFEPHTHAWDEHVTILKGTWYVGFGTAFDETRLEKLEAGAFAIIPGGTPHYVTTGEGETVAQVHGIGPTGLTFVRPRGK